MSFSIFYPYESRVMVRNKIKAKEYLTKEFKGRSSVWHSFLVVTNTDGIPVNYVMCKDCSEVFTYKGHSSGTSTLRKHVAKCLARKIENCLPFPCQGDLEMALTDAHVLQGALSVSPIKFYLGDDRKLEVGGFTGLSESSAGSGDNQGGCDEVSIPLSPEQFMSEETEQGGGSPHTSPPQRPESYKLRHNNHLNLVLESLAGDESFMDVTLTAQGKAIKAHKSVLSAVSPYFRSVLKENPCQHPIIIMPRDIRFEELNSIISYVYKGEMTVAAEDLSSLLKTAEVLQVTGLSPSDTGSGTSGIVSQMQGIPAGLMASNPAKKYSKQKQQNQQMLQQQQQQQNQQQDDDDDESIDDNDPQGRVDPLAFLNADMTCVKEEIQSDHEDSESTPLPMGPSGSNNVSEAVIISDSSNASPNRRKSASGSPKPVEDITSKPFNPGEPGGSSSADDSLSDSPPSSVPYLCPHCMEIHRPLDSLQTHLRLKHPSKAAFVCTCGRVFTRVIFLTEHSKRCKF